jgi:uncharacterized protein (DUF488 family)
MIELMTIGYEGLSPKEFLAILNRCNVETLIDVRELPLSRKKGFSKSALSQEASQRGVGYRHLATLGCPKPIRHEYRETGDWEKYTDRFLKYLATQELVLSELAEIIQQSRCCLLCFEEDYNFCHRKYVAEAMAGFVAPLRISHLTGPIQGRVLERPALLAA